MNRWLCALLLGSLAALCAAQDGAQQLRLTGEPEPTALQPHLQSLAGGQQPELIWRALQAGRVDNYEWRAFTSQDAWVLDDQPVLLRLPLQTGPGFEGIAAIVAEIPYLRYGELLLRGADDKTLWRRSMGLSSEGWRDQLLRHVHVHKLPLHADRDYRLYLRIDTEGMAADLFVQKLRLESWQSYQMQRRSAQSGLAGLIFGSLLLLCLFTAALLLGRPDLEMGAAFVYLFGAMGALSIREGLLFELFLLDNRWWYAEGLAFFTAIRSTGVIWYVGVASGIAAVRWGRALVLAGAGINLLIVLLTLGDTGEYRSLLMSTSLASMLLLPVFLFYCLRHLSREDWLATGFVAVWLSYFAVGGYRFLAPLLPEPLIEPSLVSDILLMVTAIWIYISLIVKNIHERQRVVRERAANEARMDFIARLSHEIRTPLNAVIGMTDVLRQSKLSERQLHGLEVISSAGNNLLRLINNILDFAKIESGEFTLRKRPFRLDDTAAVVSIAYTQQVFEERLGGHIHIEPDVPLCLVGDEPRLRQVLVNILGNAFKFTQRGYLVVRIRRGDILDDGRLELVMDVADLDPALRERNIDALFDAFAEGRVPRSAGAGLGLAICHRLIRKNGGYVALHDDDEQPPSLCFTWPVEVDHEQEDALRAHWEPLRNRTALLMIPEEPIARLVLSHLEFVGVRARWARTAAEADRMLNEAPTDMMVVEGVSGEGISRDWLEGILSRGLPVIYTHLNAPPLDASRYPNLYLHQVPAPITKFIDLLVTAASRTAAPRPTPPRPTAEFVAAQHVLVVDDNPINLLVAKQLLLSLDVAVDTAANGHEALQRLTENDYDLVLMDCEMPGLDGFATTDALRERERLADRAKTPVYALTAHSGEEIGATCERHDMQGVIHKPITRDQLRDLLKNLRR